MIDDDPRTKPRLESDKRLRNARLAVYEWRGPDGDNLDLGSVHRGKRYRVPQDVPASTAADLERQNLLARVADAEE